MVAATPHCLPASGFELAAVKLLLCGQAAGAHHQITLMPRAPVAPTHADEDAANRSGKFDDGILSVTYVVTFVGGLTAFFVAALTLPIHRLTVVLLALGAMALLLHALAELLQVSQVQFKRPGWNRAETDPEQH